MKRVVFWDLDRVLLRTDALLQWILEDLGRAVGQSPESIFAAILVVDETGFSWRKLFDYIHLPRTLWDEKERLCHEHYETQTHNFVAPDVLKAVQELARLDTRQHLVTFGVETFQREKWNRLTMFHPYFVGQSYVTPGGSKGEVIADLLVEENADRAVFIDDSHTWLRDALLKAPKAYRIRATWVIGYKPVTGDADFWAVARTPQDALAHVLAT